MNYFLVYLLNVFLFGINFTLPIDAANNEKDVDNSIIAAEVRKNFPYTLSGHDEDGAPIWIVEPGRWDFRKYVELGKEASTAMANHLDNKMFKTFQKSALNSTAKQIVIIGDFEGFDNRQMASIPALKFILARSATLRDALQAGYLKKMYLLNANYIFKSFWVLAKPVFGSLGAIIELYGTNKEVWIPRILKELPKEELPEWYGGSKDHRPLKVYA